MKVETRTRAITQEDHAWITRKITESWGSVLVISRGKTHDASQLPGFVVMYDKKPVGLVTSRIDGQECEVVTFG